MRDEIHRLVDGEFRVAATFATRSNRVRDAWADFDPGAALDRLALWADIALSHAFVRGTDDPAGHIARVAGIEGAWAFGETEQEALDELRSVLIGWALRKLEGGDDDIPSMRGVHLVVKR